MDLDIIIFGIFPYISLILFIIGVLWKFGRWISANSLTGLYSVAVMSYKWGFGGRFSEVLKRVFLLYTLSTSDKLVLVGSFLFHWGIWIALLGHLAMIIPPYQFGISKEMHKAIALYVGGAAGIVAMIGILLLLIRRAARSDVRRLSYLDDWFALVLLVAIIILGNVQSLVIRPDYMATVSPWLQNILSGRVAEAIGYITQADGVTKLHTALAMLFIAYVPFGKMMHPFSFLAMPTLWNKPTELHGYREKII